MSGDPGFLVSTVNTKSVLLIALAAAFGGYNVGAINTAKIPDNKTSNLNDGLNFCIFYCSKVLIHDY